MSTPMHCESCGMEVETGPYCNYCVDESGKLQSFETRFEKMVGWAMRKTPSLSREQAEQNTRAYMRKMPAWVNHPQLA
jgi:hypothetical protein